MLLCVSIGANVIGVRNPIIYFLIRCAIWTAFYKSGVHATLAGSLLATLVGSGLLLLTARPVPEGA